MDIVRAATWVAVRKHTPAEAVQQQPGAKHAHQSYERVEMGHSAVIGGACERTPQCATGGRLRGMERTGATSSAGKLGEFEVPGEASTIAMSGADRAWQTWYQPNK